MSKNNNVITQYVYILGDKSNSNLAKIGVSQQLNNRMQQHYTSNPNAYLYFGQEYKYELAARIEKTIKAFYKDCLVSGLEWFNVTCLELENFIMLLINVEMTYGNFNSLIHEGKSVKNLSSEEEKFFLSSNDKKYSKGEYARFVFTQQFKLGVPVNLLPKNILKNNGFPINFNECFANSQILKKYFKQCFYNSKIIHADDHIEYFYYLLELSSGNFFAYPIARVSLPYITYELSYKDKKEIIENAYSLGWEVTFHHEWSWYRPGKTGLILFTNKTNIEKLESDWQVSLKKWVIENYKLLENYFYFDEKIQNNINSLILEIKENINFPLNIKSFEDFYKSLYLDVQSQIKSEIASNGNKNLEKLMVRSKIEYRVLFRLWKSSNNKSLNRNTFYISNKRILERNINKKLFDINLFSKNIKKNKPDKEKEFNILKEKYLSSSIELEYFIKKYKDLIM